MRCAETRVVDVHVDDEQSDLDIDVERYRSLLADALACEGAGGPGEASLSFVGRDRIAELNAHHLGGIGPTDVVSFPVDGAGPVDATGHRMVGDVVVCPAVAAAQAGSHAGRVEDELALLVVHAALHLCGHDHALPAEREVMWRRERELLDTLWGPLDADPWAADAGDAS